MPCCNIPGPPRVPRVYNRASIFGDYLPPAVSVHRGQLKFFQADIMTDCRAHELHR